MSTIDEYIKQLTEVEKQVYEIAKEHLKSSFDITKTADYEKWLKTKNPPPVSDEHHPHST